MPRLLSALPSGSLPASFQGGDKISPLVTFDVPSTQCECTALLVVTLQEVDLIVLRIPRFRWFLIWTLSGSCFYQSYRPGKEILVIAFYSFIDFKVGSILRVDKPTKTMSLTQRQDNGASEGRVWYGPQIGAPVEELVAPWKSAGHYLLHKMSIDNAEEYLIVSNA